jgi:hypothetical protein
VECHLDQVSSQAQMGTQASHGMLAWPRVTLSQGNDASFFKLDEPRLVPDSPSLSNICLHVLNEVHFYCPAVGNWHASRS